MKQCDDYTIESLENALPNIKGNETKLNYLGRTLAKISEEGLLRSVWRIWYITD